MRHKVDPAALLIAVFVVGVGPVLQPGEWSYITTVTGTITLLVLVAFSWPTREAIRREPLSRTMIAAYSAVYAFVIAILASWPAQTWAEDGLDLKACTDPSMAPDVLSYLTATDCIAVNRDILGEAGTTGGIIVGAASFPILALGLWLWQSYAAKRTKQRRPEAWSVPDGWESV